MPASHLKAAAVAAMLVGYLLLIEVWSYVAAKRFGVAQSYASPAGRDASGAKSYASPAGRDAGGAQVRTHVRERS
jgi:hypothetical protein